MKKEVFLSIFCSLLCCFSCKKSTQPENVKTVVQKSVQKDVIASNENNQSMDTITYDEYSINEDTLCIGSFDDLMNYPFGEYLRLVDLSKYLHNLQHKVEYYEDSDGKYKLERFYNDKSFLKFIYLECPYDGKVRYQIVSAKIFDNNICLKNGFHVGMNKKDILSKIPVFKTVSHSDFNVVKMSWRMLGVWQYYKFSGDSLKSIIIDTDYILNKD